MKFRSFVMAGLSVAASILVAAAAPAGAVPVEYAIRGTPIIQAGPIAGSTEFIIDDGGDKAAIGSNDLNGATLGSITNLSIERFDDRTRFAVGSAPMSLPI